MNLQMLLSQDNLSNFEQLFNIGNTSIWEFLLVLGLSFVFGLIMYFVYLKSFRGVVYSQPFNASLVLLCMITAALVVTISSNVVLALGMVGALSIVRFRTAIKDPLDIVFLFWSISVGIITGARLYAVAAVATVIIAIVFIIMLKIFKGRKPVYLFVLRFDSAIQQDLGRVLAKLDGQVRNKSVSGGVTEITIEMQLKNNNTSFVDKIAQIDGVHSAVLVNYNGDFAD
ncbi:MAG: DUF4956 domain-containing protein [Clostridia bacterium]|nr:DUF4956 domain-containing protein [Clostridia bacterium]